jgi:hypothetical protein
MPPDSRRLHEENPRIEPQAESCILYNAFGEAARGRVRPIGGQKSILRDRRRCGPAGCDARVWLRRDTQWLLTHKADM